jgi:hypothetical protein
MKNTKKILCGIFSTLLVAQSAIAATVVLDRDNSRVLYTSYGEDEGAVVINDHDAQAHEFVVVENDGPATYYVAPVSGHEYQVQRQDPVAPAVTATNGPAVTPAPAVVNNSPAAVTPAPAAATPDATVQHTSYAPVRVHQDSMDIRGVGL